MEVDTDSIVALMSFLVGSYIFIAKNVKFEIPNREEFLAKLKKKQDAENQKKQKEAEAKVEGLMGKLFGMKKDVDADKVDMAKLKKKREEKEKELAELQKKREEREKKEKEVMEQKRKEEREVEEKRKEEEREKLERERRGKANAIVPVQAITPNKMQTRKVKNKAPNTDFENAIKALTNVGKTLKETKIKTIKSNPKIIK